MFAFKFYSSYPLATVLNKSVDLVVIYTRHCTTISTKIGQDLLKLCTNVFWCVFMPHSVVTAAAPAAAVAAAATTTTVLSSTSGR